MRRQSATGHNVLYTSLASCLGFVSVNIHLYGDWICECSVWRRRCSGVHMSTLDHAETRLGPRDNHRGLEPGTKIM